MRNALFLLTFAVSLLASPAGAATLALGVETVEASIHPVSHKPTLTVVWKRQSRVAVAAFERLRIGEEVTTRLGDERLITSVVSEPIIEDVMTIFGGSSMTDEVVRQMEEDIKSGKRAFFLDGSDK